MQSVSRTPYSSFTVHKSFQAFLDILAAHIKAAGGLFFSVCYFYVGFCLSDSATTMKGTPFVSIVAKPSESVTALPTGCNWKL